MSAALANFLIVVAVVLGALFLDSYIGLTKIFPGRNAPSASN